MMEHPDYPWAFMHRGEDGCGGPIALLRQKPAPGDGVLSDSAIHIDGSPVEFQSAMRCDTCGKPVRYGPATLPLRFVELRQPSETFREFFKRKHGFDYPTKGGEEMQTVLQRIGEAVADWMDELARR